MSQGKKLTITYWEDSSRAERLLSMGLSTVCPTQQIPMQWWHRGPPKRVFPCLQYRLVAGTIPRPRHISQPRSWKVWLRNWFSPAEGRWMMYHASISCRVEKQDELLLPPFPYLLTGFRMMESRVPGRLRLTVDSLS